MKYSDFETELNNKGRLIYTNVGDSMLPLIKQGRDLLIIERPRKWQSSAERKLKKGDVALYKRENGQYVLHRVIGVRENDYVFCGDNRINEEYGISDDRVIGLLTGIVRNGKEISQYGFGNRIYKKYALCNHGAKKFTHRIAKKIKRGKIDYKKLLLSLLYCSLNSKPADKIIPKNADLKKLYELANLHSLSALVFLSLSKTKAFDTSDAQTKSSWIERSAKLQRKEILVSAELSAVENELESKGISNLALKGVVLKKLYPQTYTREMSDIDMLYDKAKTDEVKKIFLSRGYAMTDMQDENEKVFTKKAIYRFEMHTELFEKNKYPVLAEYYSDVENRLHTTEGKKYGKCFSDEDFYVFIIAHAYKHFSRNGTGLRTLVDIFLLSQTYKEHISGEYVREELEKIGAYRFERICVSLSEKLFLTAEKPTDEENKMLSSFLISGTYGSEEVRINRKMEENGSSRLGYMMKRAFPGKEFCKDEYPFFYEHPMLLPAFWAYRFVKPKKNKSKLKNEIKILTKKQNR